MLDKILSAIGLNGLFASSRASYARSAQRLSSGLRINSAVDDAAGLAISERAKAQVSGLQQASRNIQEGVSMLSAADDGMATASDLLRQGRSLLVQWKNDTNSDEVRANIKNQLDSLVKQWNSTVQQTKFNGQKLLSGELRNGGVYIQTGANAGEGFSVQIGTMDSRVLGIATSNGENAQLDAPLATQKDADYLLGRIDELSQYVDDQRSNIGASINRLNVAAKTNATREDNLTNYNNQITGVDVARETANMMSEQMRMDVMSAMRAQMMTNEKRTMSLLLGI